MAIPPFEKMIRKDKPIPKRVLCLDPGDTIGAALFVNGALSQAVHIPRQFEILRDLIMPEDTEWPDVIVCESYRIYQHKLAQHAYSDVPTLRLIGAIEYLAWDAGRSIVWQSAAEAKSFITDDKLTAWGMYTVDSKHARDAIRHGCFYLITRKDPIT